MSNNLVEKILLENIKKNNTNLSNSDLNSIFNYRFNLKFKDFKSIFSNTDYIKLLDLSFNDGCFFETALSSLLKENNINNISIIDNVDFFFSQIHKANCIEKISLLSLNNSLLLASLYNKIDLVQYLLSSNKVPIKPEICYANYGCIFNSYNQYKKNKPEVFIYFNTQYDLINDKIFLKNVKNKFKKNLNEVDEIIKIIKIFSSIKDIKEEIEENLNNSITVKQKNKI